MGLADASSVLIGLGGLGDGAEPFNCPVGTIGRDIARS